MNILIADESDIHDLTQVEIESKKRSIPECIEDFEINYESRAYRWQTYFSAQSPQSSRPERIVLKAVHNEKIIGYLAGHLTTRYEMDGEIQSFYILKPYQRLGIGTALLGKFIDWLTSTGAKSLCVGIASSNRYKAFYLKYGGVYLNEHWIFWTDITQVSKLISNFLLIGQKRILSRMRLFKFTLNSDKSNNILVILPICKF